MRCNFWGLRFTIPMWVQVLGMGWMGMAMGVVVMMALGF